MIDEAPRRLSLTADPMDLCPNGTGHGAWRAGARPPRGHRVTVGWGHQHPHRHRPGGDDGPTTSHITPWGILAGQSCPDFGDTVITGASPLPGRMKFSRNAAERATLLNEMHAGPRRRLAAFLSLPIAVLDRTARKTKLANTKRTAL